MNRPLLYTIIKKERPVLISSSSNTAEAAVSVIDGNELGEEKTSFRQHLGLSFEGVIGRDICRRKMKK